MTLWGVEACFVTSRSRVVTFFFVAVKKTRDLVSFPKHLTTFLHRQILFCDNIFVSFVCHTGVTLDSSSFTYSRHLESLRKKLISRVALLRWLAGSGWDAGATTLRIATLALVHSTKEYSALVCCRSATPALLTPPSTTPCEL